MPTVPVYTADTGTVYTGPSPYRQALRLLVYGTAYGTGMARKTHSVIRLYGRKYGIHKRIGKLPKTRVERVLPPPHHRLIHFTSFYYPSTPSTIIFVPIAVRQTPMA